MNWIHLVIYIWTFSTLAPDYNANILYYDVNWKFRGRSNGVLLLHTGWEISNAKWMTKDITMTDPKKMMTAGRFLHYRFTEQRLENPDLDATCRINARRCMELILYMRHTSHKYKIDHDPLFRFHWQATATYYMCWHTMNRRPEVKFVEHGYPCYRSIEIGQYHIKDGSKYQNNPFECANVYFCPDPCMKDPFDPVRGCASTVYGECESTWADNSNLEGLMNNQFNVTCKCPDFYTWDRQSKTCVDIDECATGKHDCGKNTDCWNSLLGYECQCKSGYVKQKHECVPIDPYTVTLPYRKQEDEKENRIQKQNFYEHQLEMFLGISAAQREITSPKLIIITMTTTLSMIYTMV